MTILSILAIILISLGLFFYFAGTVGILRLPDFIPACTLQASVIRWRQS